MDADDHHIQGALDTPAAGASVYDQAIFFSGWVYVPKRDSGALTVRAILDACPLAETRVLFPRPDVCSYLGLSPCVPTGFRMLGKTTSPVREAREAVCHLVASFEGGEEEIFARQTIQLVPASLHERPHGDVVHPDNARLLHRENIYGSGPPVEEPSIEAAELLESYLPRQASVVDVGCGAGAYGPRLIGVGHDWLGLEANPHCGEILQRRRLPFRKVDLASRRLPGRDQEWDCAICLEVLEHVEEPELSVKEIARVIRGRALFSVPNLEVLPYLHDWGMVPWHLLEADHKNFFTRASLRHLLAASFRRVEVFFYGELPLRTRDGIALYAHLFAVAEK